MDSDYGTKRRFCIRGFDAHAAALELRALAALGRNLVPVIAGNPVGGSVLVALVYHVIYRWPERGQAAAAHRNIEV